MEKGPASRWRLLAGPRLLAVSAAAAAVLAACIQGPWDYYPKNPPPYRGVSVSGYVLADRPIQHVCFERLLDLDEESTQAFGFYDSVDIRIAGRFSGVERDLALNAITDTPNCFKGDSAALVERGRNYDLTASLTWDSAGTRVTTVVRGTAKVPALFTVHRDASAPRMAATGGIPDNIFTFEFFRSLPDTVLRALGEKYPEGVDLILADTSAAYLDTSTAVKEYLRVNGKGITSLVIGLLQKDNEVYQEGETRFYLNGALNTLSHYYSCDRSPDVQSVLITQEFDPESERPQTAFDSPLGLEPDSADFYFPGNHRRLLIYPDSKGANGYNMLDSMGVVNVWFHTKRNRLFFYGMEQAYYSYISTAQGGGGGEADPRVVPKFNVTGGQGFFVGGIPDTFDVYIEADKLTKTYPLPVVHGLACNDDGWLSGPDCRNYYRTWCSGKDWAAGECRVDAVMASLEADFEADTVLKARVAAKADSAGRDTVVYRVALNEFCVNNEFKAGICAAPKTECLGTSGRNSCKEALWNFCLDNSWSPDQCDPGLASYCHDKPRLSEVLCRQADKWCADPANAGSPLCK
jgi:hypothetical protein